MLVTLFAATLALTGQDATPAAPAPAAQDSIVVEGQQRARDKRVCKRSVSTGSIMAKVTCKSAGEWEIERDRQMAQAEQMRQRSLMEAEVRRQSQEK